MTNHKTPTKEELAEQARVLVEEAEELSKETPEPEEDPEPEPTPDPEPQPEPEPKKEEPEKEEEVEEEEPKETPEEKTARLEKENKASSREAQKIYAKNRVMNQAIIEAEDIPTPTEEDLSKEIGEDKWDVMSDVERELFKETVISRKWRAKIKEAGDQATKIEKWNESVDAFIGDPNIITANPALDGKQEAFSEFASKPENNSVPFKILVSAFLFEESTKKGHKGQMFPTGSGGPNVKDKPKSDKLSIEEGRALRESDYAKWKEYLKSGKLSTDI